MFEIEAEEYRKDLKSKFFLSEPQLDLACQGFKDGYNKAKEEWKKHFLQCSSPFCLDNFSEVKCYGELGNMAKKESE